MNRRRTLLLVVVVALCIGPRAFAVETHTFVPKVYYNTYSFAHQPALHINPGDRVSTKTVDAAGVDWGQNQVARAPNPQIGPFYIEGAEPGDTVVVTITKLETNRTNAWSFSLLRPFTVDPSSIAVRTDHQERRTTWTIDKAGGSVRLDQADIQPGIELPLEPMLGCIGVAPANKEAIAAITPGSHGGNMDYVGLVAGTKLMLPVNEPGALLFMGDGHARQGHGEVAGTGLETSLDVEFTVDLLKKKTIAWPRLESDTHIMVLGSARPLLEALQIATTEMQKWLIADFGFTERGVQVFLGQALEYDIANVVDPKFTVVAKIRKKYLPPPSRTPTN